MRPILGGSSITTCGELNFKRPIFESSLNPCPMSKPSQFISLSMLLHLFFLTIHILAITLSNNRSNTLCYYETYNPYSMPPPSNPPPLPQGGKTHPPSVGSSCRLEGGGVNRRFKNK